jgi:hypothetical protein
LATYLFISYDLPVISCGRATLVVSAVQAYLAAQMRWEVGHAVHRPGEPSARRLVSPAQPVTSGRILEVMKPARAASRRFLPTSPFGPPSAVPPAEQFAVQDQVTHDTYGLGRVIGVEVDTALVVNFGSCRVRIITPCAKLTKL